MESLAVIVPADEPRFDGSRADALLCAHAAQLTRIASKNARVRIFAVDAGEPHDLLARLSAFRPRHVLVEHAPLSYGRNGGMPLAAASWSKSHAITVTLVAHPEFGRSYDPPDSAVAAALLSAGPLVAQSSRVCCHETEWARVIAQRVPTCVERLDVIDAWPVIEPLSMIPVDTAAPRLLLLDDVPPRTLEYVLRAMRADDAQYRCVALFADEAQRIAIEDSIEAAGLSRRAPCLRATTAVELASLLASSSSVVVPESRNGAESRRWVRTAIAFGRRVTLCKHGGDAELIERPSETNWATIAHALLSGEHDRSLTAPFEEDVEEPSVGI